MNFQQYAPRALAFASLQATSKDDLIHAALGLGSDSGELYEVLTNHLFDGNDVNLKHLTEEGGDVVWFANLAAAVIQADLGGAYAEARTLVDSYEDQPMVQANLDWLVIASSRVIDMTKAYAIYGKELDVAAMAKELGCIVCAVALLTEAWGIEIHDVLDANIAKLTKRYGDKFDLNRALNRDKEAEYAAIGEVIQ